MQMLKKLFNSGSKYHLELDETESSEVVQAAAKTVKTTEKSAKKAAKVVKEKAVAVKAEAASKVENTAETVVATVANAQDNGTSAIASNSKPKKQKSAKGKGKGAKQVVQPTAKKSAASSYEPPFWVAAMNNTNSNGSSNGSGQGGEVTFASDNLMPTISKYRRLPGGSLAKFRDMAKTAKTPRK